MYKFVKGRARLQELKDLPEAGYEVELPDGTLAAAYILIPQSDGTEVPIVTHTVAVASKMLGLIFAPVGGSSAHVDAMVGKGMDWADRLTTRPLQRRDAWLSFLCSSSQQSAGAW